MKNTSIRLSAAALAVASLFASSAQAAGFMLTEQSALALGRAYAGVGVDGTDLSGTYYNPATMTLHPGTQLQLGVVGVGLNLDYKDDSGFSANGRKSAVPVPSGYITHQINDSTWFGLSMTVPFGMATEYDSDWKYRHKGIEAEIVVVDINPNMAWKLSDRVSLGAGVSVQHVDATLGMGGTSPTSVSLTSGRNRSGADETNVKGMLDATSTAWGWNVGLMWTPVDNLRFGLSYRSKITHKAEGDLRVSGLAPMNIVAGGQDLTTLPVHAANGKYASGATVSAPAWAMATAAWDVNDALSLYATFRWTDWSSFEELKVDTTALENTIHAGLGHALDGSGLPKEQIDQIQAGAGQIVGNTVNAMSYIRNDWRDTYLFAVGGDLRVNHFWTLRGGVAYETSAIARPETRTAIIPDADRWWFSVGSSFHWSKNFQTDVAFAHLHGVHERSLYEEGKEVGQFRKLDAYLLGLQMRYRF